MPEIRPSQVRPFDRLNAKVALLATSPDMPPVVPPLPSWSVPAVIVVPPVWLLSPVRVSVSAPALARVPAPDISPETVRVVPARSEEHTSELQSLMRISYAVFCLKQKIDMNTKQQT